MPSKKVSILEIIVVLTSPLPIMGRGERGGVIEAA
jgi:hypothetical protein